MINLCIPNPTTELVKEVRAVKEELEGIKKQLNELTDAVRDLHEMMIGKVNYELIDEQIEKMKKKSDT